MGEGIDKFVFFVLIVLGNIIVIKFIYDLYIGYTIRSGKWNRKRRPKSIKVNNYKN